MQLERVRDNIRRELGIEMMDELNWRREVSYIDPERIVTQCHDGLLGFYSAFPEDGRYPQVVQDMLNGKVLEARENAPLPMTSCDQVKIVEFSSFHSLADMLKYTAPSLFPNLIGMICSGMSVTNQEEYKTLQTVASRLKYLRCEGSMACYDSETVLERRNMFLPPPIVPIKEIRFDALRVGYFYADFYRSGKFRLDLPMCEVISISTIPKRRVDTANNPFEIVPNSNNKYFEIESPMLFHVNAFNESVGRFTYMEELLYIRPDENKLLLDAFLPIPNLKRISCANYEHFLPLIPFFSPPPLFEFEGMLVKLLKFHKDVLDFVVKKISLERIELRYGRSQTTLYEYIFEKQELDAGFPRLVLISPASGITEYDDACKAACNKRDVKIHHSLFNILDRTERSLEEMMQTLSLAETSILGKFKISVVPASVILHIASFLNKR